MVLFGVFGLCARLVFGRLSSLEAPGVFGLEIALDLEIFVPFVAVEADEAECFKIG